MRKYDADGNFQMYDTLKCFVNHGFDIVQTANDMIVHKNTIRYRINKAKEVLKMDAGNIEFNEAIFLALQYDELIDQ